MAWYDESVFYHIYPLGLCGAPRQNHYDGITHRLRELADWIPHIKEIGCTAVYIGPLFESGSHGYDTTDYKKLDCRLGDNQDLKDFVKSCHEQGIHVIFDGVFNHTGRDFFAMRDIRENRENSRYRDWYCNVNFWGNNEYNDGFSYDNWGGFNLLAKLNQRNPEVRDYLCDVVRFWVKEFDVDGIRLDAADVLDFDFMKTLRSVANEVKPDFWLMGEVIHGDYTRWANEGTLHSVTNYNLHKALYSGHNDHNYFEIAHTVKRLYDMGLNRPGGLMLYNFVDNHDVERIYTKLSCKAHFTPVHIQLYTLPGIPSVYYGSEFAIEGRKEQYSDDSLRPALNLKDYADAVHTNPATALIARLGEIKMSTPALSFGDYRELMLTNRQYAFSRNTGDACAIAAVNNDDNDFGASLPAGGADTFIGLLSGEKVPVQDGRINITIKANSGDVYVPFTEEVKSWNGSAAQEKNSPAPVTESGKPAGDTQAPTVESATGDMQATAESAARIVQEAAQKAAKTAQALMESAAKAMQAQMETREEKPSVETSAEASPDKSPEKEAAPAVKSVPGKTYEDGIIAGHQQAVLARMEKNGPVTDQMRRDVENNVYHDSLINWIKSF